jgi:hypothetical protein
MCCGTKLIILLKLMELTNPIYGFFLDELIL